MGDFTSVQVSSLYQICCDNITKRSTFERIKTFSLPIMVEHDIQLLKTEKMKLEEISSSITEQVKDTKELYFKLNNLKTVFSKCRKNHQRAYTLSENDSLNASFNHFVEASSNIVHQLGRTASVITSLNESEVKQLRGNLEQTQWTVETARSAVEKYNYNLLDIQDFQNEVSAFTSTVKRSIRKKLTKRRRYLRGGFTKTCKLIKYSKNYNKKTSNITLFLQLQEKFRQLKTIESDIQNLTPAEMITKADESFGPYETAFNEAICLIGKLSKDTSNDGKRSSKKITPEKIKFSSMRLRKRHDK